MAPALVPASVRVRSPRGGEEARGHHPGLATDKGKRRQRWALRRTALLRAQGEGRGGRPAPGVRVRRARAPRRRVPLAVKGRAHERLTQAPAPAPAPASRRPPRSPARVRLPDATDRGRRLRRRGRELGLEAAVWKPPAPSSGTPHPRPPSRAARAPPPPRSARTRPVPGPSAPHGGPHSHPSALPRARRPHTAAR